MRRIISKPCVPVMFLLALNALPLWGQAVANATIAGTVIDANGGLVPNAQITATQTETGMSRTTASGADGTYILPNLPVGPYTLEFAAKGFSNRKETGTVLQVGASVTINAKLDLGSENQHVTVQANASMVETQQTSMSQVIDDRRMVDLPLNGRNVTQLIVLAGAASNNTLAGDLVGSKSYPSSTTMSIAGGQGSGTNYLMDGADYNDPWSMVDMPFPFPDALQEFSVESSSLTAQYGVHPGGVVNAVTKSGTNTFHGGLFEFVRNGDTNARNFFAASQDTLRRNQFGGTVGGPIKKDKLFFFFGYQGTRTRTAPPQTISFVPTQAVLNGDFSTLESASCQSTGKARAIVNPATGLAYPNDQVPVSSFNPAALALLKSLPISSNPCGRIVYAVPAPNDENQELGRVDWTISPKQNVFARYFLTKYDAPAPNATSDLLLSSGNGTIDRAESAVIGDNYLISPNAIDSLHLTWSRTQIARVQATGEPTPSSLGINTYNSTPDYLSLSATGYFSLGGSAPAVFNRGSVQVADDFDWIRGRHHFAFGGEFMYTQLNDYNVFDADGIFAFSGQFSGDALLDLMLGRMSTYTQSSVVGGNYRQDYVGVYAQDNFRVTPHFHLNFGVRWEPFLPTADNYNRGDHFDPAAFAAGKTSQVYVNAPAGLFFVGDTGIPKGYTNRRYTDFAPRVGLVWDPKGDGRQSLRGGYGVFYDFTGLQFTSGFSSYAPFGNGVAQTSPPGGLSNPWAGIAGGNPYPLPFPPSSTAVFPTAASYYTLPLNMKPTTMQQWDLSYSRQVKDWVLSATYLGNSTHHLPTGQQINPSVYIPGTCSGSPCSSTKNTTQRRVLYLENPTEGQYYGSILNDLPGGDADYEGIIFSAKSSFSRHYTVMANYTYSHCISDSDYAGDLSNDSFSNPTNLRADFGNCAFDIRQNFNASVVVSSPTFRSRLTESVLGGWQLSPIITYHSGLWFSPVAGLDNSLTGVGLDRANAVGNSYIRNINTLQWLNPSAFSQAAAGTFGDAGRDSLSGPGMFDLDAALSRKFHLHETHMLELRFEFFNALNHPQFSNPSNTLTASTFGEILAAGNPRILQFALKYTF